MVIKITRKKVCVIIGIILAVAGIIALVYAQNEINSSSWRYTWTQPYTNYESKIMTIKNIGTGSLILGVLDIAVLGFYKKY